MFAIDQSRRRLITGMLAGPLTGPLARSLSGSLSGPLSGPVTYASRSVLAAAPLGVTGCAVFKRAVIPMAQLVDQLPNQQGRNHLIVFLPGAYDSPQDFFDYGFVKAVRDRRLAADIIAIDSHLAYFNNYTIPERMRDDVLLPARQRGYRSIWLVGISLGGLGSLLTTESYPGVTGVVALAPYVATAEVIAEVKSAGGLAQWRPETSKASNGWERRLLNWFKRYSAGSVPDTRLLLGYGLQDRFAASLSVLGQTLDPKTVLTQPGGHDWPTWTALWQRMLNGFGHDIAARLS